MRDDAHALLARNPELRSAAVRAVTDGIAADGSLAVDVSAVEDLVSAGMRTVSAQSTQALADHRAIERECPGGQCQALRDAARAASEAARRAIAEQQAAVTAAGGLLRLENVDYGAAVIAEALASTQVANGHQLLLRGHRHRAGAARRR